MDKRALFLARHELQRQSFYTSREDYDEDAYSLLISYLYGAAIEALRPSWAYNKTHAAAWKKMAQAFREYDRPGVNFADIAMAEDLFENRDLYNPQGEPLVDVRAIGIIMSSNDKDMRFTVKTLKNYFKAAFPDGRTASQALASKMREPVKGPVNISRKTLDDPILGNLRVTEIPIISPSILQPALSFADESKNAWQTTDMWIMLLLGAKSRLFEIEDAWEMLEEDFPKTINKRVLDNLLEVDPTEAAILGCDKAFRPLLGQLYLAKASDLKHPFEIKDGALVSGPLESVSANYLIPALTEKYAASVKLNTTIENAARERKGLEGQVRDLDQKLKKVRNMEEQVRQAEVQKQDLAETKKALQKANAEIKRLDGDLNQQVAQNRKLEASLETSESLRRELDDQLADLMDNRDEIAQPAESETISATGVRERIGEDAYQLLCGKRLTIVGGHSNTHTTLRELFPNWQYYSDTAVVRDAAWAVDAIVCITSYTSHVNFHLARDRARSRGILFIPIPHNGPSTICQCIIEGFAKAGN